MAAHAGRKVSVKWKSSTLTGIREKSLTIGGDPIDITTGDDDGWRHLLTEPSEKTVEIGVNGVISVDTLRAAMFQTDRTGAVEFTYPDGAKISGTFYLSSYKETGPYKDAQTFDATFQSTGTVTYTAAA